MCRKIIIFWKGEKTLRAKPIKNTTYIPYKIIAKNRRQKLRLKLVALQMNAKTASMVDGFLVGIKDPRILY